MPIKTALPLLKSRQIFRNNDRLVSSFFAPTPVSGPGNIRKLFLPTNNTLDSVFDSTVLTQGSTAGSSDQVRILNTAVGTFVGYFFRAGFGWRLSTNRTGPDQGGVVIPNNVECSLQAIIAKNYVVKGQARIVTYQTSKYV